MNPIAFKLLGIEVRWYGILISIGMILGLWIAYIQSDIYDISFDVITDIFIISLPISVLSARLYYVIFNWSYYNGNPLEILNIRGGGLAIHGGILGAILSTYFICKHKKINYLQLLDLISPSFILAQGIGRWGNFFNSEAHGGIVSKEFISHFPKFIQKGMFIDGSYYHPTFLYESLWDICIFIILIYLSRKRLKNGSIFYLYIILYSVGRFFIEGLRTDSLMIGHLRMAQIMSLILIIIGTTLLILKNHHKKISL
ncbi:prolipoprotein diacylglyceryl transferase [Clostridium brassicae]|uniref:Phosphatidylglycerol--prolipoprotein diacylglyceryl transferase n=1 Tax=Clostridium brassicae TaxID=2999072 RepID=A0ABT4DE67_9CLOT|nr:prolipoprotein diacylglyceryl transferase [Clostridium brassicae]MCY6960597.1 prolipoprotein diacylglyceryl transferase [Clostridium brassicae]